MKKTSWLVQVDRILSYFKIYLDLPKPIRYSYENENWYSKFRFPIGLQYNLEVYLLGGK